MGGGGGMLSPTALLHPDLHLHLVLLNTAVCFSPLIYHSYITVHPPQNTMLKALLRTACRGRRRPFSPSIDTQRASFATRMSRSESWNDLMKQEMKDAADSEAKLVKGRAWASVDPYLPVVKQRSRRQTAVATTSAPPPNSKLAFFKPKTPQQTAVATVATPATPPAPDKEHAVMVKAKRQGETTTIYNPMTASAPLMSTETSAPPAILRKSVAITSKDSSSSLKERKVEEEKPEKRAKGGKRGRRRRLVERRQDRTLRTLSEAVATLGGRLPAVESIRTVVREEVLQAILHSDAHQDSFNHTDEKDEKDDEADHEIAPGQDGATLVELLEAEQRRLYARVESATEHVDSDYKAELIDLRSKFGKQKDALKEKFDATMETYGKKLAKTKKKRRELLLRHMHVVQSLFVEQMQQIHLDFKDDLSRLARTHNQSVTEVKQTADKSALIIQDIVARQGKRNLMYGVTFGLITLLLSISIVLNYLQWVFVRMNGRTFIFSQVLSYLTQSSKKIPESDVRMQAQLRMMEGLW